MTTMLLTMALKTTLVLTATLALAAAARRRSAAVRHWVLTVGMTSALLLPILSGLWPSSLAAPMTAGAISTRRPVTSLQPTAPFDAARAGVTTTATMTAASGSSSRRTTPVDATRLAVLAWAVGAALALSRLGWGLVTLRRLTRQARPVVSGPWRTSCDALARQVGLARPVRLLRGPDAAPPVTWGWRRPTIVLPEDALAWPQDRREVVLAHELAHIVRHDWMAQLAGEIVRGLHWYHPLAWSANRRLRLVSEYAADDRVVGAGVDGADYAGHLLALAQHAHARARWTPAPAIARQSSLEGRIRAMLDTSIDRTPLSRRSQVRVAALACAALLPLAALTTAQSQFHTLHGTIVDTTGRVLPNVTVSLVNDTTAARYEVRSDTAGRYEFVGLPAAGYSLEAKVLGFQTRAETVSLAGDRDLPLRLAVGTLQETITVTSSPSERLAPADEDQRRARDTERDARAAERQARAVATCAAGPPTTLGGNILPPWKMRHVNPAYPDQARAAGLGGTVRMRAVIDTSGAVREVNEVTGPSAELEAAAVEAVREWRFTPTLLNCEAIEVEMSVTVTFDAAK